MQEQELIGEFQTARGLMAGNPLLMPPGALVDGRNVTYRDGRLCKRRGYTVLKANGVGAHPVRLSKFFRATDWTPRLIALTEHKAFSWDPVTPDFHDEGNLGGADVTSIDACEWGVGTVYICKQGQALSYWDGGAATDFVASGALNPIGGAAYYPSCIRPYNNCLVGANDGTNRQAVCWSNSLTPNTFAGTSFNHLIDARGQITALELVGKALAIFAEESIHTMLYVGGTPPFIFHRADATVGTLAPRSIGLLGPPYSGQLVFLGSDFNIHTFDGLRTVPQADVIHPILKDLLEEDYLGKANGFVWPKDGVYYLSVPTSGSAENNLVIEWRYRLGQFYLHQISGNGGWTAAAQYPKSTALTWAGLTALGTTWAHLDMSWAELMQTTGRRPVGFFGTAGDFVRLFDGLSDAGAVVNAYAEFAPFASAAHETKESDYLEILDDRSSGASNLIVAVGGSADGASFTFEKQFHSLLPTTEMPKEDFRASGRWFKVKVQNLSLDEQFNLRGWRLYGKQVGRER